MDLSVVDGWFHNCKEQSVANYLQGGQHNPRKFHVCALNVTLDVVFLNIQHDYKPHEALAEARFPFSKPQERTRSELVLFHVQLAY